MSTDVPKGIFAAFFGLLGVFGIIFMVVIPPFQAPDEFAHFYRTYAISELDLFSDHHDVPTSVMRFMGPAKQLIYPPADKVAFGFFGPMMTTPLDKDQRREAYFTAATLYPPLIYVPQALGFAVGRLIFPTVGGIYYSGRLFNLLAWALLGYFTLRLLPGLHRLYLLLLFMPMAFYLAVSVSPDVMTVGLALLFSALVLRLASDCTGEIGWGKVGWLTGLCALTAMTKVPYFLLSLIYFLIPWKKFGARKMYVQKTAVFFGLAVAATIIALAASQAAAFLSTGTLGSKSSPEDIQPKLAQMINHPTDFVKKMGLTFKERAASYPSSYIGRLGWLDLPLPRWIYASYPLALVLAMASGAGWLRLNGVQKGLGLAFSMGMLLVIQVLMYLSYTQGGSATIQGVQGRYFLPLGPLPYLVFANRRLEKQARLLDWGTTGFIAGVLAASAVTIFRRYYG